MNNFVETEAKLKSHLLRCNTNNCEHVEKRINFPMTVSNEVQFEENSEI